MTLGTLPAYATRESHDIYHTYVLRINTWQYDESDVERANKKVSSLINSTHSGPGIKRAKSSRFDLGYSLRYESKYVLCTSNSRYTCSIVYVSMHVRHQRTPKQVATRTDHQCPCAEIADTALSVAVRVALYLLYINR